MKFSRWLQQVYDKLLAHYGKPRCSLNFDGPYQLFVAVVLSAQCTDERVNKVTPALFERYPDMPAFAEVEQAELEQLIKSCGFAKVKSTNLIKAAQMVCDSFSGKIPETMDELITLPGFGRKSANVMLGNAFDIPGFPVDTHVNRVLNRIGIVDEKKPEKIEAFINKQLKPEYWTDFSHLLIIHGRATCQARKPSCSECCLQELCHKNI